MLSQAVFASMVSQYIMSLVAGTKLTSCTRSCPVPAELDDASTLILSQFPGKKNTPSLLLSRTQHFTPEETRLVRSILSKWEEAFSTCAPGKIYWDVIAARAKLEAIAEFIDPECTALLMDILETMVDWAGQSYEGRPIAFSVGVDNSGTSGSSVSFREIIQDEFLKVMTSGHDTLLVCNPDGGIHEHVSLFEPDGETLRILDDENHDLYAPINYIPIARWAENKRYAAVLNPEGEILLFKEGSLLFARRRGKWFFFTHSAYIAGLSGNDRRPSAAKALYQTMLDVSFARTGGCLGLLRGKTEKETSSIAPGDRLFSPDHLGLSPKNRFLRKVIAGRKFQDLQRKFRMELAGIDGATVILGNGEILAVGAILKIEGGSTGGGRTAAAMELAKHGAGVKISNDGEMTYWTSSRMRHKNETHPTYAIG